MDAKASQVSCALILPPLFPPALAYPACVPARRSDSAPLRRGRRKPTISAHRWCSWRGWRATKVGPSVTRAQYPPTHSAKIAALDRVRSSAALLVGPENCQGGDPDARGHRPAREHRNAPVRAKKKTVKMSKLTSLITILAPSRRKLRRPIRTNTAKRPKNTHSTTTNTK